jgi:hypothetical protein
MFSCSSMRRKLILAVFLCVIPILNSSPSLLQAQNPYDLSRKSSKGRFEIMRGTVEVFSQRAITVRDAKNMYLIRTFSYDPALLPKMQKKHFKRGDRVKVKYIRMTDTAVAVK